MKERFNKNTPYKWLKYDIMDYFGLRDISEVSSSIHRYSIKDYEKCLCEVKESIDADLGFVFVIKLVYFEKYYRLPNYLIISISDWKNCKENLALRNLSEFSEIWYCKNEYYKKLLFGRALLRLDDIFPKRGANKMEIVWGASARLIEKYPNLSIPFVSLYKDDSTNSWKILDVLHDENIEEMKKDITRIIDNLKRYKMSISDLCEWLYECGCTWVSIEFSMSGNDNFRILDWDTDNDKLALKKWRGAWEKD